jgi:hypothetical protein
LRAGPPGRPKAPAAPPRPRPPAPGRAGPPRKPPPAGAPAPAGPAAGAAPLRKPPPPPRPPGPPRPPPGLAGPPRPPSPAPGRPGRLGVAPGPGGRGGIMPGFGRGPPLPGEPVRPVLGRLVPPGRGGMLLGAAGLAGGAGRWPGERGGAELPTPKGLLPTRGERGPGLGNRGRGAPWPVSSGRPPGRCSVDGRGDATRCSAAGRCGSVTAGGLTTGSSTPGGSGMLRRSAGVGRCGITEGETRGGAPGMPPPNPLPGPPPGPCSGTAGVRRAGAGTGPGLAAAGLPAGRLPVAAPPLAGLLVGVPLAWDTLPVSDGNESRSLRATGASTVEEADFTYSPRSASFLSTSLLVTPSSFASSCTRALPATALLTGGAGGNPARPRYSCMFIAVRASRLRVHFESTCSLR